MTNQTTNKTTCKGYITYINTNDYDYIDTQKIIEFNNLNSLDDLVSLLVNDGYQVSFNKIHSLKLNDKYYHRGYDKNINLINNFVNKMINNY